MGGLEATGLGTVAHGHGRIWIVVLGAILVDKIAEVEPEVEIEPGCDVVGVEVPPPPVCAAEEGIAKLLKGSLPAERDPKAAYGGTGCPSVEGVVVGLALDQILDVHLNCKVSLGLGVGGAVVGGERVRSQVERVGRDPPVYDKVVRKSSRHADAGSQLCPDDYAARQWVPRCNSVVERSHKLTRAWRGGQDVEEQPKKPSSKGFHAVGLHPPPFPPSLFLLFPLQRRCTVAHNEILTKRVLRC